MVTTMELLLQLHLSQIHFVHVWNLDSDNLYFGQILWTEKLLLDS